ncbi:hypothetical protein AVEN_260811-2-1, partial [Araneus ventricosus]
ISRRTAPEFGLLIVNKERNYFPPVKCTQAPETARVQASVEWDGLRRDGAHRVMFSLVIFTSRFEATRGLILDGPLQFEQRPNDACDT